MASIGLGAVFYILYFVLSVSSAFLLFETFAEVMSALKNIAMDCMGISREDDLSIVKAPMLWAGLAALIVFLKKLIKQ